MENNSVNEIFEIWLFSYGATNPSGPGFHIIEASRSLSDIQYGRTPLDSNQPDAETSTCQHTSQAAFEPPISASERPQIHIL